MTTAASVAKAMVTLTPVEIPSPVDEEEDEPLSLSSLSD